jgi:hypothetical protein
MSKGQWAFRPAVLTPVIKAAEQAGKRRGHSLRVRGNDELEAGTSLGSLAN